MDWQNKRVLIVGKGKSGRAAYDRLTEEGAWCAYYDDNDVEGEDRQLSYGAVQGTDLDCAVLSPAVSPAHPLLGLLRQKGVPTMAEVDLGYLFFKGKIIAVTGTNGKTTTVREIEAMLQRAGLRAMAVGNVGVPFVSVREPLDVAVVEMSSFQCHQSVLMRPHVAAVTNIAPDHIEWHGSMAAYRGAKLKLLEAAEAYALNVDDADLPRVSGKPCYPYSLTDTTCSVFAEGRVVYVRDGGEVHRVAKVDDLPLAGNHNVYNVLCALALATATVGYRSAFADSVLAYRGERMRVQLIGDGRPRVYNDSKGTNTAATIAAMRQMVGDTVLLLGGWDKGEDYLRLWMHLPAGTSIVCFGAAGARIASDATAYGWVDVTAVDTLAEAVRVAMGKKKDNVLFSPSCSSFDAYSSYVERGIDFEKEIRKYL